MTLNNNLSIPPEIVDKIKDAAVLHDVIADFVELHKKGSALEGPCPYCSSKKFSVAPSKNIYKCWSCDKGGNNAVQFLIEMQGMNYLESLRYLADRYKIVLEEPKKKKLKDVNRKLKFRDAQMVASGISEKDQKYYLSENENTKVEADRYQAATIDRAWNVVPGDDMILHYLDLDGMPMKYQPKKGNAKVLLRVRWAQPDLHLSKDGDPMKYQSPYESGSHLWFPNKLIQAYRNAEIIDTLYITEGEKKADRMCKDDIYSVGIMGIHNFTFHEMPRQFELLIKRCNIRRIVFAVDADWQDLSMKPDKPADNRPRTFYRAVQKFRDYFYAYSGSGIYLDIFFAYGKDQVYKGMDDLLCRGIKKDGITLKEDFEAAFISRDGVGTYVNVHKITDISDYQLKEYWHLHSPVAFMKAHADQLKQIRDFQFNKLRWRWNEEENEFQLAQKIMPHEQFWGYRENQKGEMTPYYIYQNMRVFLNNRGYGQYEHQFDTYRFVQIENKLVKETSTSHIRRYVRDFVEDIDEKPVLEMILRGGNAYMGADKLADIYTRNLDFMEGDRDTMYLFFQDQYWQITATGIESRSLNDMPKYVWENNLLKFSPKLFKEPMLTAERKNDTWQFRMSEEGKQCDMCIFALNTSTFHWRKTQKLVDVKGKKQYVQKDSLEEITDEEVKSMRDHFMAKVLATGYTMHDYLDYSLMKAVVCMDGNESEVGRSQGGTGKSIFSDQFDHMVPMEVIDGKSKTIEDDKHIYELVDERTRVITFDDVRVNFNFEWLFSQITRGMISNPKGQKRTKYKPKKYVINTNHALNGEGNSYKRRQYMLGFSDYYNEYRTPYDDFGYQLFHDWDYEEWNRYYNWVATCMQLFLLYRLDYTIPTEALERRRLRQQIGESLMEWCALVFDQEIDTNNQPFGIYLNKKIERNWLYNKYLDSYPEDKRYTTSRVFKEKIKKYTEYASLHFNPTTAGERLRSDGKEYFIIGAKNFDAQTMAKDCIQSDFDYSQALQRSPF